MRHFMLRAGVLAANLEHRFVIALGERKIDARRSDAALHVLAGHSVREREVNLDLIQMLLA